VIEPADKKYDGVIGQWSEKRHQRARCGKGGWFMGREFRQLRQRRLNNVCHISFLYSLLSESFLTVP